MAAYMKPPSKAMGIGGNDDDNRVLAKGFVVRDAPWNAQGNKVINLLYNIYLSGIVILSIILFLLKMETFVF